MNRTFVPDARHRNRLVAPVASFIVVYALLYGAFGAASPFLPALIEERGIRPELIGALFAAGTAIRLISAPIAGHIADRTQAHRLTLAVCAVVTAFAVMGFLTADGFWPLLVVSLVHAFAVAPTTNLADALALVAARRDRPKQTKNRGTVVTNPSFAALRGVSLLLRWGLLERHLLGFLAHPPPKVLCFIHVESVGRVVVEPDQHQPLMSGAAYCG